jgi:hypothetical protein
MPQNCRMFEENSKVIRKKSKTRLRHNLLDSLKNRPNDDTMRLPHINIRNPSRLAEVNANEMEHKIINIQLSSPDPPSNSNSPIKLTNKRSKFQAPKHKRIKTMFH